ncbi:MAG: 4Fe-4S dicluster domain-containing protein [Chloroflexi bacterium]|nr:4Fe-4S dicluster domain-containing protein [Chloroflexota bacterium]
MKMILPHPEKCVACHLCEGACSFKHEGSFVPAKTRIWVYDFVDEGIYGAVTCFHCKDAPCLSNCPTYAITRDPATGQVTVNDDKCIGCKMCMVACPFGVMGFHMEKNVAHNCDLCGGDPQCVKVCIYDALEYAEVEPNEWMLRLDEVEKPAAAT